MYDSHIVTIAASMKVIFTNLLRGRAILDASCRSVVVCETSGEDIVREGFKIVLL